MARLLSLAKVVDDGLHNSMTDLVRWSPAGAEGAGDFWLAYRSGERHDTYPPGEVVLLRSADARTWSEAARLSSGMDDRDPKLIADGKRLLCSFGSHEEERTQDGERVPGRPRLTYTHVTETTDGVAWQEPRRVFGPSWWLWAPRRFDDGFWSCAYGMDVGAASMEVIVAHSPDGYAWTRHAALLDGGTGNEGALHRFRDGRMLAVVRGSGDETHLFEAQAPYTDWRRRSLPHWLHAPVLLEHDGRLIAAGRDRDGADGYVTRLWALDGERSEHLLDLPSGGDTSYCGLARDADGHLLVSYYSQHEFLGRPDFRICEKPSAVYVARVEL